MTEQAPIPNPNPTERASREPADALERQEMLLRDALAELSSHSSALAIERARWTAAVDGAREELGPAVLASVTAAMADVVAGASEMLGQLMDPLASRMTAATGEAEAAAQSIQTTVSWATSRLLGWCLGGLAGLIMLGWLSSGVVFWWDTNAIAAAHETKRELQMEVAELRANREAWVQAGMAQKLERCGMRRRLCIAVDETAGAFGEQSDRRIVKGF